MNQEQLFKLIRIAKIKNIEGDCFVIQKKKELRNEIKKEIEKINSKVHFLNVENGEKGKQYIICDEKEAEKLIQNNYPYFNFYKNDFVCNCKNDCCGCSIVEKTKVIKLKNNKIAFVNKWYKNL